MVAGSITSVIGDNVDLTVMVCIALFNLLSAECMFLVQFAKVWCLSRVQNCFCDFVCRTGRYTGRHHELSDKADADQGGGDGAAA